MRDLTQETFSSLYNQGFARVAAVSPKIILGSPLQNARKIGDLLDCAKEEAVAAAVFPEMCLTGYCLGDLVFQDSLLNEAVEAVLELVERSADWPTIFAVGLPLRKDGALYNCAAVIHRGEILGIIPKSHLPSYGEFYDRRYFSSGLGVSDFIEIGGRSIPFGTDILFEADDIPGLVLGVEICEDLWAPKPSSTTLALAGANVILNLSASPARIGRKSVRDDLCQEQSRRLICAYVYANIGEGESTTDLAWDGQCSVFEAGEDLTDKVKADAQSVFDDAAFKSCVQDIDLKKISALRMRSGYFSEDKKSEAEFRRIFFRLGLNGSDVGFRRSLSRFPFLAATRKEGEAFVGEALTLQASSLCARLRASKAQCMVVGVSGGLDSAWALLVASLASDMMGWDRSSVVARTLPSFVTGTESLESALDLMQSLEVDSDEVDIAPLAYELLTSIGHEASRYSLEQLKEKVIDNSSEDEGLFDVTFENVQAGARTDYLFRLAGMKSGLVVGTGDMSEMAQGWCTYGVGDQMSHYGVNAGLPKTLLQQMSVLIAEVDLKNADLSEEIKSIVCNDRIRRALLEIADRPVSPELLPAKEGVSQETEKSIGPYCLQDFNLYYVLRYGFSPARLAFLAMHAWGENGTGGEWPEVMPPIANDSFSFSEIVSWLERFTERFYAFSQFKRSAMPDGPKLLEAGSLSPRGDWRAPSDLSSRGFWHAEIKSLKELS